MVLHPCWWWPISPPSAVATKLWERCLWHTWGWSKWEATKIADCRQTQRVIEEGEGQLHGMALCVPTKGQQIIPCQNGIALWHRIVWYIIDEINVNVTFLLAKILAWPNFVANAMKQKKSEEQKLLTNNNGNNWYGNDLILRLIHTLDETEIWCSYMRQ